MTKPTLGILGAGKLGITLGQLAQKAGYSVAIASSGSAERIELIVKTLVPGAAAGTAEQVARENEVVILALPLGKYKTIPKDPLKDKVVIDAMNHWWEVDGPRDSFLSAEQSSSEAVQEFLHGTKVVKAFNHMGYHDLHDEARLADEAGRKAIAIAGDDESSVDTVQEIVDDLGFDPVVIGGLAEGKKLEAGKPAFGANLEGAELQQLLMST